MKHLLKRPLPIPNISLLIDKTGLKNFNITEFVKGYTADIIPKKRDTLTRMATKLAFLLSVLLVCVSCIYFVFDFNFEYRQKKLMQAERDIFVGKNAYQVLKEQNSDYVGWLSIDGTELNNPIYQSKNNSFYLNHNFLKKKSKYGSLTLDSDCDFYEKNVVIYGNTDSEGYMLSVLHEYRNLDFFKENWVVNLTAGDRTSVYKIYAVFVLNSLKSQDNGNIYDIYKKNFASEEEHAEWVNEAKKRSLLNIDVNVNIDDKILTLVTDCDDFDGARFIVMARKLRKTEIVTDPPKCSANREAKFPKKWYDDRNIEWPAENFKTKE